MRQAFEEALHTHSYQHIIESLGLDEAEVFNMYREVPSVAKKASWALPYTKSLNDPTFNTGTPKDDQRLLRDLIAFYVVFESIFLLCRLYANPSHGTSWKNGGNIRTISIYSTR